LPSGRLGICGHATTRRALVLKADGLQRTVDHQQVFVGSMAVTTMENMETAIVATTSGSLWR